MRYYSQSISILLYNLFINIWLSEGRRQLDIDFLLSSSVCLPLFFFFITIINIIVFFILKLSIRCCKLISNFSFDFSTYIMKERLHTCILQHAVKNIYESQCLFNIFICSLVAFYFGLFLVFLNVIRLYYSRRTQSRCRRWTRN